VTLREFRQRFFIEFSGAKKASEARLLGAIPMARRIRMTESRSI